MQLINIGFGNIILAERIIAIISPDSSKKNDTRKQR